MLDEQETEKFFIAGIGAEKMAQEIEKQELELRFVEEAHREQRRKHFQMGNGQASWKRTKEAKSFWNTGETSLTLSTMSGEFSLQ